MKHEREYNKFSGVFFDSLPQDTWGTWIINWGTSLLCDLMFTHPSSVGFLLPLFTFSMIFSNYKICQERGKNKLSKSGYMELQENIQKWLERILVNIINQEECAIHFPVPFVTGCFEWTHDYFSDSELPRSQDWSPSEFSFPCKDGEGSQFVSAGRTSDRNLSWKTTTSWGVTHCLIWLAKKFSTPKASLRTFYVSGSTRNWRYKNGCHSYGVYDLGKEIIYNNLNLNLAC